MIHVVALLARAGHGKTTIARHLSEECGAKIVSLAAPLKKIAKAVMDFSDDQLYGTQAQKEAIDPRFGMSARIFLQKLGTEGLRVNIGENVFCDALVNGIEKDATSAHNDNGQPDSVYVVDDARFINEVAFVNRLDRRDRRGGTCPAMCGYTIKIVCSDAPPSGNDGHASEAEIDKVQPYMLAAEVVSSRAQGVTHLLGEFEGAISHPTLAGLRSVLSAGRTAARVARNRG